LSVIVCLLKVSCSLNWIHKSGTTGNKRIILKDGLDDDDGDEKEKKTHNKQKNGKRVMIKKHTNSKQQMEKVERRYKIELIN